MDFKKREIFIFPKGIVHEKQRLKFSHLLSLSKIDREKVFADVLDTKKAFKDYKSSAY